MEKRNILRKTKSEKVKVEPPKENVLDDDTFQKPAPPEDPQEDVEIEVENEIPAPKDKSKKATKSRKAPKKAKKIEETEEPVTVEIKPKKEQNDRYAHLEKARQKSLETRRRKKEEKIRMQIEAEKLQEELRQQKEENARLKSQYSAPTPDPTPPPPRQTPAPKSMPVPQVGGSFSPIDYDVLADRIYGKFNHVEQGLRQEYEKELNKTRQEYEEKIKKLAPPPPVPRTQLYTSRRQKPNRAFDRGGGTGYWGMTH